MNSIARVSQLSTVTAVIIGVIEPFSILILAVLRRMSPNIKIIFYQKSTFTQEARILTSKDKVIFLNHPYLKNQEILTLVLETMATLEGNERSTVVGVIEYINWREWTRAIANAKRIPLAKMKPFFCSSENAHKEFQETLVIRVLFDLFTDWDQHCSILLRERVKEVERMIAQALDLNEPWDTERALYLSRHFSHQLEPDAKIIEWQSHFKQLAKTHQEALNQATDLGDGIWLFVQPQGTSRITEQSILFSHNPALIVKDSPHDPYGHRTYFIAEHEISVKAITIAKEREVPYEASGSQVWVKPDETQRMIEIYRELLTNKS